MKHLLLFLLIFGFGISGSLGQTIKTLGFNTTNGQVVANTGTNVLTFPTIINAEELANSGDVAIQLANRELIAGGQSVFIWDSNYVEFGQPITFAGTNAAPASRANLGFSTNLNTLWTATNASNARSAVGLGWSALTNTNAATSLLGFTTNGQIVANTGTNTLQFTNNVSFQGGPLISGNGVFYGTNEDRGLHLADQELYAQGQSIFAYTTNSIEFYVELGFSTTNVAAATRANLGFSTNLNTLWTATNASDFRNAIGLGATNTVTFSNVVNNGNFTNSNGTIYGLKTNVGPFEGIGNFFASNNTAVGNETLFRVGVAETTNKSAQFGFRIARTNNGGEGLAVFSVFGYNALMMIGPSDRSRSNSLTNTNAAIEADIWTMHETNRVMTLRDTNTGATVMHRPIGFNTNEVSTTAPSNTTVTNPTGWIQIYVGTNSVRVPYYQ